MIKQSFSLMLDKATYFLNKGMWFFCFIENYNSSFHVLTFLPKNAFKLIHFQ